MGEEEEAEEEEAAADVGIISAGRGATMVEAGGVVAGVDVRMNVPM